MVAPNSRAARFLLGLVILALADVAPGLADDPPRPANQGARALFESYCVECHSGQAPRGGLALDRLLAVKTTEADLASWEKVWKLVRHEFMPPAHADRPSDQQRRDITRWVEREVFAVDEARPD